MKTLSKILVIAVCFFGVTEASAQRGNITPERAMKFLDKNDDGKISLEEAKKARKKTFAENFTKIDTNEDGFIDKKELKAMMDKRKKKN